MSLWRAFEVMESRAGNSQAAQNVYQRSIRDAIKTDEFIANENKQMVRQTSSAAQLWYELFIFHSLIYAYKQYDNFLCYLYSPLFLSIETLLLLRRKLT